MSETGKEAGGGSALGGPLSAEHLRELSDGRARTKKVRRAASFAAFSGWSMAVFAGLSLMFAIFGDWSAWAIGIGLAVIAGNELRGAGMLKKIDARGARVLGWNQIALGVVIVVYAGWSFYSASKDPALNALLGGSGGGSELISDPQMKDTIVELTKTLSYAFYGLIAAVGVIVPGLTAWYYFSRGRVVRAVIEKTPAWVLDAIRAAG
jgi:hypothetical protein